jgi:hypothetical protein
MAAKGKKELRWFGYPMSKFVKTTPIRLSWRSLHVEDGDPAVWILFECVYSLEQKRVHARIIQFGTKSRKTQLTLTPEILFFEFGNVVGSMYFFKRDRKVSGEASGNVFSATRQKARNRRPYSCKARSRSLLFEIVGGVARAQPKVLG